MVKFNTELMLPSRFYGGPLKPEGLIWHGMSAINANTIGLDNSDPFDIGVCIAILKYYKVSAHVLIGRDGVAYQTVPFDRKAWHAGVSLLNSRKDCNDWCLSIEMISIFKDDNKLGPAFTDAQIKTGLEIQALWAQQYPMLKANIAGHDEVRGNALRAGLKNSDGSTPTVKPDPGKQFPWRLFKPAPKPHAYGAAQVDVLIERSAISARRLADKGLV
jgi:N-acetyl-anhydromuramyl-L-alanine amidase AmpD